MEKLIGEFSFGLFFWQSLIFIGLIFLLKKFAWKPILDAVDERENSIKSALFSAKEARKEMKNLQEDNVRILKKARSERDNLLKEARQTKLDLIESAREEAKSEAQKIIIQAKNAIENEKRIAIKELKNHVASISIEIAEKVIKSELDDKTKQQKLVDKLLNDTKFN
jgi:F-type H+-transporting ATPase subunit b